MAGQQQGKEFLKLKEKQYLRLSVLLLKYQALALFDQKNNLHKVHFINLSKLKVIFIDKRNYP